MSTTMESRRTIPAMEAREARVSVIIRSWRGEVARICASLEEQTFADYALHVVAGVSPVSRATNVGAAEATGEYLLLLDDDITLGHKHVLARLVAILDADPTIGAVGPSIVAPPGLGLLQRRIATEVPRWTTAILDEDTETNPPLDGYGFSEVRGTCCLMRRAVFEEVGGYDEDLVLADDTELFYRIHRAGYRLVMAGQSWFYHAPPDTLSSLIRKHFNYGIGHAREAQKSPDRRIAVIPLERWYGRFLVLATPFFFVPTVFVSPYLDPRPHLRVGFRPVKALATYATLYGYAWGWFHPAVR